MILRGDTGYYIATIPYTSRLDLRVTWKLGELQHDGASLAPNSLNQSKHESSKSLNTKQHITRP